MKKVAILLILLVLAAKAFSQIETDIKHAVSSLEREPSFTDNFYLQGQFMNLVKKGSHSELLNAYNKEGFKRFTKMTYVNGEWKKTTVVDEDSTFLSILNEIQVGLPKTFTGSPTSIETETIIDDYVTDYWLYTNRLGQKCEVRIYFINNQFRSIGYWVYL